MCTYAVDDHVIWKGDNQSYRVTAVHQGPGGSGNCTYDIALRSNESVTQSNVPDGNLKPDVQ